MSDFLSDPLWYKDALIYELHVRSFYDASGDGFGDFQGLREKLPYLQQLGVNTLWLLPFLKSPLKDDGYDTADYYDILPMHGTLDDFKAFLEEAHERGMRVVTELVINHTSDQHPWFQEARDPNSDKHDWYVWSETAEKYQDARIIFTDTEVSNWTWDRQAQKYYWHRFFSHQPDLNFDNPEVREAVKEVMFYWFDLGVDGLRLDAIPYLYERENTTCENLPETIAFIQELRQVCDERYGGGKVLLAEANQWPEDTLPYFGKQPDGTGTGVQMAFNFPIMPRMYMALRRENRRPLVEMLELTRDIPDDAQWATFLRNHDELTLEMVTDEERDYMYHEYASDQRFRINVGIRRRLAPLLEGERRRIELMNALLLSLPGSPVLYYGDEIGMGDDPFLGDRNGVRTPMQWSPDRNGGFSSAPHHRLFMPPVNRGLYSYEFVNVEDLERDAHSFLHFMRRLIAQRQRHVKTFGRGDFRLLPVENQSVLAFVREHEGERILVVANLSRYAQSIFVDPDEELIGHVPVEMFSQASFPVLTEQPYHVMLPGHGFYWFALRPQEEMMAESKRRLEVQTAEVPSGDGAALPTLRVPEGVQNVLVRTMARQAGPEDLERHLPEFVQRQRWFGSKGEGIKSVQVEDAVRLQAQPYPIYLSVLGVELESGRHENYTLPMAVSRGEDAERVLEDRAGMAVAWLQVEGDEEPGLLHDAVVLPDFWMRLFKWWQRRGKQRSLKGEYVAEIDHAARGYTPENARLLTGEQSNTAALLDDRFFVKLYRRLEQGQNPETELLGYLTEAGFPFVPQLYGTVTFRRSNDTYALGILQQALPVETDGWSYALEMAVRFLDRIAGTTPPNEAVADVGRGPHDTETGAPAWLENVAGELLQMAQVLGIRTAEMHLALSKAEGRDLAPQDGDDADPDRLADRVRRELDATRELVGQHRDQLSEGALPDEVWDAVLGQLDRVRGVERTRQKIRVHGDYHLGQVLRADGDFYLLDFEGEPARSLPERRARDYALRDVAGMLRSLDYALLAAWQQDDVDGVGTVDPDSQTAIWVEALTRAAEATFLDAYLDVAGEGDFLMPREARTPMLWAYLLDKALYEIRYELNHRPSWTWLPVQGLLRLAGAIDLPEPDAADRSAGVED